MFTITFFPPTKAQAKKQILYTMTFFFLAMGWTICCYYFQQKFRTRQHKFFVYKSNLSSSATRSEKNKQVPSNNAAAGIGRAFVLRTRAVSILYQIRGDFSIKEKKSFKFFGLIFDKDSLSLLVFKLECHLFLHVVIAVCLNI